MISDKAERVILALLLSLCIGPLLASCGAGSSDEGAAKGAGSETAGSGRSKASTDTTTHRFSDLFRGVVADDRLYSTAQALANDSQIVIEGTIKSVDKGRTFGLVDDPDVPPWWNVLMQVNVTKVHAGTIDQSVVHVELPAGHIPPERFENAAQGARVIMYLVPYAPESPGDKIGRAHV